MNDYKYTNLTSINIVRPHRQSPSAIAELLRTIGNMYPDQYIVRFQYRFDSDYNETYLEIATNGERWPGQFTDHLGEPEPPTGSKALGYMEVHDVVGGNGPKGSCGTTADGSTRGDSDGR